MLIHFLGKMLYMYVQNDLQKRRLGTSITFIFDEPDDMQIFQEIGNTGL